MKQTEKKTMLHKREAKLYHGLISLTSTAVLIFIGVVLCGAEPQIPLQLHDRRARCALAGPFMGGDPRRHALRH